MCMDASICNKNCKKEHKIIWIYFSKNFAFYILCVRKHAIDGISMDSFTDSDDKMTKINKQINKYRKSFYIFTIL